MAILTAFMAMFMMLALAAGMTLTTMTETAVAANHRDGIQALYAAEAGIEIASSRLQAIDDWAAVLDAGGGAFLQARFVDLVQDSAADPRIDVTVSVLPDPGGNGDVLVLQATARVRGGPSRSVEGAVRR